MWTLKKKYDATGDYTRFHGKLEVQKDQQKFESETLPELQTRINILRLELSNSSYKVGLDNDRRIQTHQPPTFRLYGVLGINNKSKIEECKGAAVNANTMYTPKDLQNVNKMDKWKEIQRAIKILTNAEAKAKYDESGDYLRFQRQDHIKELQLQFESETPAQLNIRAEKWKKK